MDKPISHIELKKNKRKRGLYFFLIIALIIASFFGLRSVLKKKVKKSDFFIATVDRGEVVNTFTASGLVIPAFERQINAPVATEIKRVILSAGSEVKSGDLILELDQEYTKLEYEKLKDELELKKNNIDKLKLRFDKDLQELDYHDQIKSLQVEELIAEVADQKRLLDIGGTTAEELEQAELKLKVSRLEKKILENNLQYSRSVNVNEKRGLELEFKIQEKRLQELHRKLKETSVRSTQSGVITWINEDIGRTVEQGETLVKIADLGKYNIEASSSDRNSQKIHVGLIADVRIGSKKMKGTITRILPAVENNTVKFYVSLDEDNTSFLRPNMRAEVFVITDKKVDVVRVKNGSVFRGADKLEVFFVIGNKAVKRTIRKGLSNSDYVEILTNAEPGDQIIISDMEKMEYLDEFILTER